MSDEEEPERVPLFDTDVTYRQAYGIAFWLAGIVIVTCLVEMRTSWTWVIPIPLAVLGIIANLRTRRAVTAVQMFVWLVLVGVGLFGSFVALYLVARAHFR